ncbi:MAG TPA: hypothetical protein VF110_10645 [Burkholderiales bacterium]
MRKRNVLILGASYGSLLATKLAMAGHNVSLVCTRATADLINRDGTVVRFPLKGREPIEISSNLLPGDVSARCPEHTDPGEYDMIILGMQEAQYGADGVRELMRRIAKSRKPCLAIMNMPPLPYLKRIPGLDAAALAGCYADASVWEGFDPARITLASPDAQAFRPAGQAKNVLHVGLPTNFKAARFESEEHTELLRELEADIENARLGGLEIPVKLKVHDSLFVPLAKWPMLIAGNYRCIRADGMVAIREAVHDDVARSREVYDWVAGLCNKLGAQPGDLVPFEKYAQAADGLAKPSSAARALFAGALHIDRVDRLVRRIARQIGLQADAALNDIVALVDERLARNRLAADPLRRAA